MPRDLVDAIKALRKENSLSADDVEKAIEELARAVLQLQDEVAELRRELNSRGR